jgi:hypothetical protein
MNPKPPAVKSEAALKTGEAEGSLGREETEPELDGVAVLAAVIRLLLNPELLGIATTDEEDVKTDLEAEVVFEVVDEVDEVELVEPVEPVNSILS